jgi:hypothetical protein
MLSQKNYDIRPVLLLFHSRLKGILNPAYQRDHKKILINFLVHGTDKVNDDNISFMTKQLARYHHEKQQKFIPNEKQ